MISKYTYLETTYHTYWLEECMLDIIYLDHLRMLMLDTSIPSFKTHIGPSF